MAKVKDPVCGMEFDSSQAEAQTTYKGQAYYFCSEECRRTFDENPKEFVGNVAGQDRGSEGLPPSHR
jgi:Cu+-exporting ATPase